MFDHRAPNGPGRAPSGVPSKIQNERRPAATARVSDAVALALHLGIPIHAEDTVLDTAAVANTAIRADGDDRPPDEVEQFRRFLDTTSPEDFDPD